MRLVTLASLAAACLAPGLALAQQPAGQAGAQQVTNPTEGAAEVVGLFGQTCVHYAGSAAALRAWLTQESAPQMPAELAAYFLAGRQGQVFDVSTQNARLALVSGNDNTCSAYVDAADPNAVVQNIETAMKQGNVQFALQGDHPDQQDPSLHHRDYRVTLAGQPWLILVTTANAAAQGKPQAVLTLHPGS